LLSYSLGVSRKTGKPIKPEKNNRKNRTEKKNRLNRLHFLKNRPVWFGSGFISKKPKKPNRTETGRFDPVSVRFRFFFQKKNIGLVTFFDKNRAGPKMITPNIHDNDKHGAINARG